MAASVGDAMDGSGGGMAATPWSRRNAAMPALRPKAALGSNASPSAGPAFPFADQVPQPTKSPLRPAMLLSGGRALVPVTEEPRRSPCLTRQGGEGREGDPK